MEMTRHEAVEILEEVKMIDDSMFAYSQAYNDALDMAIEMLKSQEPRVLSLEEARDFFVIEFRYFGKIRKMGDELTVDDDCRDYYNRVWRIWNRMPTDDERRATPWN